MLQNPHRSQPEVHHAASKTGAVPVGTKKLAQQAQKRRILGVLSVQGELFRAHTHHQATQGELFAHKAQQHGDIETTNTTAHPQQGSLETGITSAPENAPKTPISHPQRRRRFQSRLGRRPQRRHRFQTTAHLADRARRRCPWAAAGPGRAASGRPTLQTSSNQRNSNHLARTPVTNVVNLSPKTTIFNEKARGLTTFVTTGLKSTRKTPWIDDVRNNTHQSTPKTQHARPP